MVNRKEIYRKYYQKHKDKIKQYHRKQYKEGRYKEQQKQWSKNSYKKNKDKIILASHKYYLNNKDKIKEYCQRKETRKKIRINNKRYRQKHGEQINLKSSEIARQTRKWISDYKKQSGCIFCGEKDPIVLEFHHRKRSEKTIEISLMIHKNISEILKEIEKCDILCANCHRRWHHFHKEQT